MVKLKRVSGELISIIFGVKVDHPKVWIMQRLIFLIILTLLLIKPTANAIFLSKVGVEALPIAYVMVAVSALIFTLLYNKFITKTSPLRIFYTSIQASVVLLVLIGIILWTPWLDTFGAYLFYLFISIFGILSASQFWILANQVFDAREARKYFGIIGFGAIAGGVTGGYLASIISTVLQSEVIPFVAASVLIMVLYYIKQFSEPTKEKASLPVSKSVASDFKAPIKLILASKHLTYIALVIAVSVFASKLIDYQFGYFATQYYTVEEDLTAFYGFMYSTFNLVALGIQLLLTTRIIGRFGIGYSLLLLPFILVINGGLLILLPSLVLVGSLKIMDASMKQSIYKASIELIMLPVPKDIKLRTKTFLDVFVDSIATGVSGIVLLVVIKGFDMPNWIITAFILIAAMVWLYMANRIRQEYKKVFRQSLNIKSNKNQQIATTIEKSYETILRNGTDFQILKALTFLQSNPIQTLEKSYLQLLKNKNPIVVKSAVDLLTYIKHDYSQEIEPFLTHNNQNIRIAAFEYIINHQHSFEPNFLIDRINSEDPEIRITAVVAYAKEFKNDPRTLNILRIEDRLQKTIALLDTDAPISITAGTLKAIGYGKFSALYPTIDKYLLSQNTIIRNHAISAAGETQSSHYLKKLIVLIDRTQGDENVVKAIAKYPSKRIERVISNMDNNGPVTTLRYMTKVLELKPSQGAVSTLQILLYNNDMEVRHNAIGALRVLSDNYPLLQIDQSLINKALIEECKYSNRILKVLSLYISPNAEESMTIDINHSLINLLKHKIDSNLKIIFELLHIKYPPENYLELYDYVKGADSELRNNAIEYVDNSLTYDLKSAIVPLLDYITNDDSHLEIELSDIDKVKSFLLNNQDEQIRKAAIDFYGLS